MKPASDAVELFLCAGLDRDQIRQLAFETGFCEREPRKIQPADFLAQLCVQSAAGVVSYNDLAAGMEAYAGVTASRQAYWEKTDESCALLSKRPGTCHVIEIQSRGCSRNQSTTAI